MAFRAHDAIKKGVDQWNALRVVTKGNSATVFINDQQAIAFKGQPPRGGGMIGVHGESGKSSQAICEFSHIAVSK